jgi:hypothetical protein
MLQVVDDRERSTRLYRVKQVRWRLREYALAMGASQRREARVLSSDYERRHSDPSESACRRLPSFQWSRSASALPPLSSGET